MTSCWTGYRASDSICVHYCVVYGCVTLSRQVLVQHRTQCQVINTSKLMRCPPPVARASYRFNTTVVQYPACADCASMGASFSPPCTGNNMNLTAGPQVSNTRVHQRCFGFVFCYACGCMGLHHGRSPCPEGVDITASIRAG